VRRKSAWPAYLVAAATVIVVAWLVVFFAIILPGQSTPPAPNLPTLKLAVYVNADPGTTESANEIEKASGLFDYLISYTFWSGSPTGQAADLATAAQYHVGIVPDVSPPTVKSWGAFSGLVKDYCHKPGLGGWLVSDEYPSDSGDSTKNDTWQQKFARVQARANLINELCPGSLIFGDSTTNPQSWLRMLHRSENQLMLDFYPYPDQNTVINGVRAAPNQSYGSIPDIQMYGQEVWSVAHYDSWFVLQGMGWSAYPPMQSQYHFGSGPAPDVQTMECMAQLAAKGGAYNFAIYSWFDAANQPGQLDRLLTVARWIKAGKWDTTCPANP
jgi:hypothetical protein